MAFDLYQQITDRIIAELEKGTVPWHKPWSCSSGAISRATGKPYSVLNQLLLPQTGEYVTFRQAIEEGHLNGTMTMTELARICGLSRPTIYKYMKLVL